MEEGHFIKCEPEWPHHTEESPNFEADVRLHCGGPVEIKVEPNQTSDDLDILESIKEEFVPQDVKEEPSDDTDSGTLPNELQSSLYHTIKDGNELNSSELSGVCSNDSENHEDLSSVACSGQDSNEVGVAPRYKDNKSFACKDCEKVFRCQSALAMHILIHTGERPFVCTLCPRTFRQKGTLKIHIMRHKGEKQHPYVG